MDKEITDGPGRVAMISSTARDLPLHREQAMAACLRQGMFPKMMEHLPASYAQALDASVKMVEEAEIYIGIFAHRYGYEPVEGNPDAISITEMEYNSAVARKIPRLIFIIDKAHRLGDFTIDDIDQGESAKKLARFKARLESENIVKCFKSPEDLRAEIVNSISQYLREAAEAKSKTESGAAKPDPTAFHNVREIPARTETYIAHPYTLLQTHALVGRQPELNILTAWVAQPQSDVYLAHILSVVAIGGMGKSALTWKWFNDIAPHEMKPLAGRIWWSFYESDTTFENFIIRALAYISGQTIEDIRKISPPDREAQLLEILDQQPFLIVLDGLERILNAYARVDAARLADHDYDRQTANFVANVYGLPASAAQSFTGEHRLRKSADPRVGSFLKRLSQVRAARVLISTRLYPFDLQRMDALPLPGCTAIFLPGLSNDDALNLWRSFGVSGSQDQLVPLFNQFGNHALLVQALASEIANYRPAPGNFEMWRAAHPNFDPSAFASLKEAMGHVLEYAMHGLEHTSRAVLQTIAGFRMPAQYDTLASVLVGEGKPCTDAGELDAVLSELEDRGLVGWDRQANRYDLHPIVRGVVWSGLGDDAKQGVYANLQAHFEAVPKIEDYLEVNNLEDLTPTIELYHTLIGLGRYDDAYVVFRDRLNKATLYRLSANRQRVELLELLFPDGLDQLPRLSGLGGQSFALDALSGGYQLSGQPGRAVLHLHRANAIDEKRSADKDLGTGLCNLSETLQLTGDLRESEAAARRALVIFRGGDERFREGASLGWLGLTLAARGEAVGSASALGRSLRIWVKQSHRQFEGVINGFMAQRGIWFEEFAEVLAFADRAWELAQVLRLERDFIRAARVHGEAALGLRDHATADERLHHALSRARAVNLAEEELPVLNALAELRRRQGDEKAAREFLDDVWEYAERGPYPLLHADALNVLAQIERDAGNPDAAIAAATKGYELSWCDGPPFAYHWGLIAAKKHLEELGVPLPDMPPFDESKFEPMPEVEINPDDEFHAGPEESTEGI